jgi:hypothetical protein
MADPRTEVVAMKAASDHNCAICILSTMVCHNRRKSFDQMLFETALSEKQSKPA